MVAGGHWYRGDPAGADMAKDVSCAEKMFGWMHRDWRGDEEAIRGMVDDYCAAHGPGAFYECKGDGRELRASYLTTFSKWAEETRPELSRRSRLPEPEIVRAINLDGVVPYREQLDGIFPGDPEAAEVRQALMTCGVVVTANYLAERLGPAGAEASIRDAISGGGSNAYIASWQNECPLVREGRVPFRPPAARLGLPSIVLPMFSIGEGLGGVSRGTQPCLEFAHSGAVNGHCWGCGDRHNNPQGDVSSRRTSIAV